MDVPYIIKMESQQYNIGHGVPPILLPVHPLERTVFNLFDETFRSTDVSQTCVNTILSEGNGDGGYTAKVRSGRSSKGFGFDIEMLVEDEYRIDTLDDLRRLRLDKCRNDEGPLLLTFRNRLRNTALTYRLLSDTVQMVHRAMTSLPELKQKLRDTVHLVFPKYGRGELIDAVQLSHSSKEFSGAELFFPMKTSRDEFIDHFMGSVNDSYRENVVQSEQTILKVRERIERENEERLLREEALP